MYIGQMGIIILAMSSAGQHLGVEEVPNNECLPTRRSAEVLADDHETCKIYSQKWIKLFSPVEISSGSRTNGSNIDWISVIAKSSLSEADVETDEHLRVELSDSDE